MKKTAANTSEGSSSWWGEICCCSCRSGREIVNLNIDAPKVVAARDYVSPGPDKDRLDEAIDAHNYKLVSHLLKSEQKITAIQEVHPWSEKPKTIGSLAALQLARAASIASSMWKKEIDKDGTTDALVAMLDKSDDPDDFGRRDAAIIALYFMTFQSEPSTVVAYKAGAMEKLMQHKDTTVAGVRICLGTIFRNMCIANKEYCTKFVELGGIDFIASLLRIRVAQGLPINLVLLEAVLDLQDLIETADGTINEERAKLAIEAGVAKELKDLHRDAEDEDLKEAAQDVGRSLHTLRDKYSDD